MGLKVYGMGLSPNVARVIAAINEKGLDYELVPVNLTAGDHKKPEFVALSPFGQIPALEDGDIKLFESRAINRYIATHYKQTGTDLLPLKTQAELAALEVWLEVESQHFASPVSKISFELLIKPLLGLATDEAVVEATSAELSRVFDVYEERLSENKYFAGGEFTLADLNHMPYVYNLMKTKKKDLVISRAHLKAWWDEVSARPAWLKTAAVFN